MKKIHTSSSHRFHSILETLKRDHTDLREMIEVLKSDSENIRKKKATYADFSKLLKAHAKTEEQAVYTVASKIESLRSAVFEAYEEHAVAEELMKKISYTRDDDRWLGRVKVLGESVEHHIIEEESELLKNLKQRIDLKQEQEMVDHFIALRTRRPMKPSSAHAGVLKDEWVTQS